MLKVTVNKSTSSDIIIALIMLGALFVNGNIGTLRLFGYGCVILSFILLFVELLFNRRFSIKTSFVLSFLPILVLYFIGMIREVNATSIKDFILLAGTLCLICFISSNPECAINSLFRVLKVFLPVLLGISLLFMVMRRGINPIDHGFKSIYSITTFFGLFCTLLFQYSLLGYRKERNKIWLLFSMLLAYFVLISKVRTAYVGLLLSLIVFVLWQNNHLLPKNMRLYRFATYALIAAFTLVYPILDSLPIASTLSAVVYKYTGKLLFTGRQQIWKRAFSIISEKLFLGYGLSFSNSISGELMSVHNSYLNVMLQMGIVGLLIVVITINGILRRIEGEGSTEFSKITEAFTLINLFMCVSEVMLLQGQVILQLLIWIMMAIGLGTKNLPDGSSK